MWWAWPDALVAMVGKVEKVIVLPGGIFWGVRKEAEFASGYRVSRERGPRRTCPDVGVLLDLFTETNESELDPEPQDR